MTNSFKLKIFAIVGLILFNLSVFSKVNNHNEFSDEQLSLILNGETTQPMRVFLTTNESDSLILRSISQDVIPNSEDENLNKLIKRMYATVTDSNSLGVGIAAPQVGILKNVIWVQRFDKVNEPFEVYLNPKVLQYTEMKQTRREGCLSIPNRMDTLNTRSYAVLIEYDHLERGHQIEMIEGFTAIIFQHEIDHLNGILYYDYLKED